MVSPVHRFLFGRQPEAPDAKRVWVLYGTSVDDFFFHDLLRGCVDLRTTLSLWAREEWGSRDGQEQPIVVRLTSAGNLEFDGNPDPEAAARAFDLMRNPRPARYGHSRRRDPDGQASGNQTSTEGEDGQELPAAGAAQGVRSALGEGQGLVNRMGQIAAALESGTGQRMLVIVERFAEQMDRLDGPNLAMAQETLETRWLVTLNQQDSLVVFTSYDLAKVQRYIVPSRPGVEWTQITGPSGPEIAEALVRVSRRRGFVVRDAEAVGATLVRHRHLRSALGNPARVVLAGQPVSLQSVLDLPPIDEERVSAVLRELDALVGLEEVKQQAREVVRSARARRRRLDESGTFPEETMHLVFSGGAGTGKTTVARIFARLFHALGVLPKADVVEVNARKDIFSPTVNQTGANMQQILDRGLGGVVFIDEAHQLGDPDEFAAAEAIEALIPMAYNNRDNLVIILAGYEARMMDVLNMDEGMRRRFPLHGRLRFADYTAAELWQILLDRLDREGWRLDPQAEAGLQAVLSRQASRSGFGNAGGVENLVTEIVRIHDSGPGASSRLLTADDLPEQLIRHENELVEAQAALESLVGLSGVRRQLTAMIESIAYDIEEGEAGARSVGNMVFFGPPGTGKTTVARLMANMLYGVGALASNVCVEVGGAALSAPYMGQTAPLVARTVESARDGVLFIDEAYGISSGERDEFGQQAMSELVRQITDPDNGGTLFILAGYQGEMDAMLRRNPGLLGRFPVRIGFDPFTPDDCVEVARRQLEAGRWTCEDPFLPSFRVLARRAMEVKGRDFDNARWARSALEGALTQMRLRVRQEAIPSGDPRRRLVLVADLEEAAGIALLEDDDSPGAEVGRELSRATVERLAAWAPSPQAASLPIADERLRDRGTVADRMVDSAVHLLVDTATGRGAGTGFVVTTDGLVATNAHVVTDALRIEALLGPDRGSSPARVVLIDGEVDLALLSVDVPSDVPMLPVPLGVSHGIPPLTQVVVVGNAQVGIGESPRVVVAHVARNQELDTRYFETDGAIEPGFSGGPVVDLGQGAAVGVVVGGRGDTVKMMVRIEHLRRMLEVLGYSTGGS